MRTALGVGCAVAVAACCGCERVGQAVDSMRPAQPPAVVQRAPLEDQLPEPVRPVPPWESLVEPDVLFSLEDWDKASPAVKEAAARHVAERLPIFTYAGLDRFSSGGKTHEVALFQHTRTGLGFVLVPAGRFVMGSPATEAARSFDEVRRNVTLTRPFLICRTEVSQRAWGTVRGENPSHFPGEDLPIETVTMLDVERFLIRAKLELPTEAQWEYACRAGTTGVYGFGDAQGLDEHAWYDANAGGRTHPVGQKKPNAFGLFDVHGNVLEWCRDGYDVPTEVDVTDPEGLAGAGDRVVRGGSWQNAATVLRSAFRLRTHPGDKQAGIGFRPVKVLPAP